MDPDHCRRAGSSFGFRCFMSFRVCMLLRKTRQRRLLGGWNKVLPACAPRSGDASSVLGWRGCVSPAYLAGFSRWWSSVDSVFVRLCVFIYKLDPFVLYSFSSTTIAVQDDFMTIYYKSTISLTWRWVFNSV